MAFGYIYKTTNRLNDKVYIGQHKGNFEPGYFGSGKILKRAIDKYGYVHLKLEVISFANTKEQLDELEKHYITEARKLLSKEKVYNICNGGEGATLFGKNNGRYIDGRYTKPTYCIDCGKEINYGCLRCGSCDTSFKNKGEKNGRYINGYTLKPTYCVDCGSKIKFDSIRCRSHAASHRIEARKQGVRKCQKTN